MNGYLNEQPVAERIERHARAHAQSKDVLLCTPGRPAIVYQHIRVRAAKVNDTAAQSRVFGFHPPLRKIRGFWNHEHENVRTHCYFQMKDSTVQHRTLSILLDTLFHNYCVFYGNDLSFDEDPAYTVDIYECSCSVAC